MGPEDFGIDPDKVYCCPMSGCWIWMGADSGTGRGGGYGKIFRNGKYWYIHRWVMTIFMGKTIPKNIQVDHRCRVRSCFNPHHLQKVKQSRNMKLAYKRRWVKIIKL